jgi:predicted RNase H-like HicB family nuclease
MSEFVITLKIEKLEEGVYLATSDDLPGLIAQGRTIAETIEIAQDVARKLIESYMEHGDELPSLIRDPDKVTVKVSIGAPA